jgi:guanine nucleotide-binding protein alpha-1 subunit
VGDELPIAESDASDDDSAGLHYHLESLSMRLLPLRHIESLLIAKLVPPNEDEATHLGLANTDSSSSTNREIFVRPGLTWKGGLHNRNRNYGRPQSAGTHGQETLDETQIVLNQCCNDMIALWNDKTVRDILKKHKVRLEESPGLYVHFYASVRCISG